MPPRSARGKTRQTGCSRRGRGRPGDGYCAGVSADPSSSSDSIGESFSSVLLSLPAKTLWECATMRCSAAATWGARERVQTSRSTAWYRLDVVVLVDLTVRHVHGPSSPGRFSRTSPGRRGDGRRRVPPASSRARRGRRLFFLTRASAASCCSAPSRKLTPRRWRDGTQTHSASASDGNWARRWRGSAQSVAPHGVSAAGLTASSASSGPAWAARTWCATRPRLC